MAFTSISNTISLEAIILYSSAIFWTLGYDTIYGAQDIVDSEELFKALATAGAGNEIGKIVVNTAADKFYIVAYDNNDAFIYYADAGAGNTDLVKGEVNYVATISGTGNIAVAGLDATDFVLA